MSSDAAAPRDVQPLFRSILVRVGARSSEGAVLEGISERGAPFVQEDAASNIQGTVLSYLLLRFRRPSCAISHSTTSGLAT
jgi:hypothetical protein